MKLINTISKDQEIQKCYESVFKNVSELPAGEAIAVLELVKFELLIEAKERMYE